MIVIKGDHVRFEMTDGTMVSLPDSHGIIHDADGENLPFCDVYFGPFEVTNQRVQPTKKSKAYHGRSYEARRAIVDIPISESTWAPIGESVQVFYRRRGKDERKFFHKQTQPVPLSRCVFHGITYYRLELAPGCQLDDRGFVRD